MRERYDAWCWMLVLHIDLIVWSTWIKCIDAIDTKMVGTQLTAAKCVSARKTKHRKIMAGAKFVHRPDYGLTIITSKTHKYKSFGRCLIASMLFIGLSLSLTKSIFILYGYMLYGILVVVVVIVIVAVMYGGRTIGWLYMRPQTQLTFSFHFTK